MTGPTAVLSRVIPKTYAVMAPEDLASSLARQIAVLTGQMTVMVAVVRLGDARPLDAVRAARLTVGPCAFARR